MNLIWQKLAEFTENYKHQIKGKYNPKRVYNVTQELSGGSFIKEMFNNLFKDQSEKDYKVTQETSDEDIQRAIDLHQGYSIPGFPSIDAFMYLINPELEKLQQPAIECLNEVSIYMERLANELINKVFERFPQIMDIIQEICSAVFLSVAYFL